MYTLTLTKTGWRKTFRSKTCIYVYYLVIRQTTLISIDRVEFQGLGVAAARPGCGKCQAGFVTSVRPPICPQLTQMTGRHPSPKKPIIVKWQVPQ